MKMAAVEPKKFEVFKSVPSNSTQIKKAEEPANSTKVVVAPVAPANATKVVTAPAAPANSTKIARVAAPAPANSTKI